MLFDMRPRIVDNIYRGQNGAEKYVRAVNRGAKPETNQQRIFLQDQPTYRNVTKEQTLLAYRRQLLSA